ncbi:AAA family ATPase [Spirosoma jeollabukense]
MLKRVSIQNFKSLKDVTLDLQKVNLLIGPNNSGKTNFLKALELIGPDRKGKKHDVNQINFEKKFQNKINIELLWPSDNEDFDSRVIKFFFDVGELNDVRGYYKNSLLGDVILGQSPKFPISLSDLEKVKIYKPDPNKLTQPGPVGTGEEVVSSDASNLVGFLDLMLSKYRRTAFYQIETDLHKCVSEFVEIKLDDAARTDELIKLHGRKDYSFKRIGLKNGKQDVTYWADELSEGTLYFLALLCIINQPNPPKLLLLEEPEKGIHPRRIHEVIQFIFALAEDKGVQVIMTTHSPTVVDMFKDMPNSVFIFDKDDEGATHVKNLQTDIIEPETEESKRLGIEPPHYTSSLGNAWTVGFLGGVPK